MSEPGLSFDEEMLSPDIFSDADDMTNNLANSGDSSPMSVGINELELMDDVPEWKGVSMDDIHKNLGIYGCQELPPICPSSSHTVLILLPLPARGPPKPYPSHQVDKWYQDYVRMPHSKHNLYPMDENGSRCCRNRWEIIQQALLQSFVSVHQLETAILSYNHIYAQRWDFAALRHFFLEVVDEEETNIFFKVLLPKMIQLALQLPVLVTGPVPLLKRHTNGTISLSQLQIASLLANAFFCTFPRRNSTNPQSEYARYPYINFNRLFSAYKEAKRNRSGSVMEKMKCIFHYFRRVTTKAPEGVVTIQRRYIPKSDCPKWDEQAQKLLPLHVTSKGTIETEGTGLLQVDFANKYVGGGVLGFGCVQEEIRFAICPELLVTMLVTEELDDTEALIVCGVERYSKYEGYSNSFKWVGDYVDETPKDSSGRRLTSILAIDALRFTRPLCQFSISNITRELNKAYVGFVGCEGSKSNLPAVATGNWGCGAFRGNPKLKVLLQLMAAAVTGRSMVYFTFGDATLRDDIAKMYTYLVKNEISIAHIFSLLVQYQEFAGSKNSNFYNFLYNRGKIKSLAQYLSKSTSTKNSSTKDDAVRSSKSINNEEKRSSYVEIKKHQETEEERIQRWLVDIDEDAVNKVKIGTLEPQKIQSTDIAKKKEEHAHDRDNIEKKKKPFLEEILHNTIQSKINQEQTLTGLDALDIIQEQVSNNRDNVCSQSTKGESFRLTSKSVNVHRTQYESARTSNEKSISLNKHEFVTKASGQRKISDFFQRTS